MAAPIITPLSPVDGEEDVAKAASITFTAVDVALGVSLSSVVVRVRGTIIVSGGALINSGWSFAYEAITNGYSFAVTPNGRKDYHRNEPNQVDVDAEDTSSNATHEGWTFYGESIGLSIYEMLFDGVRRGDE